MSLERSKEQQIPERWRRADLRAGLLVAAIAALIFANSLGGEFVYDDTRQIVGNHLIQESRYFGEALTSDVWAFKGGDAATRSNYWRPTFVAWLIFNRQLFGLRSPFGWHVMNVLLHALVTFLAFVISRRLGLARPIALAVALVFAVHPVHTESVAWISGSPDLLVAAALLGSMWFVMRLAESVAAESAGRRGFVDWIAAIALYAVALGAKEIAILFPVVVFFLVARPPSREEGMSLGERALRGLRTAMPFAVLALAYLVARQSVVGETTRAVWAVDDPMTMLLSWPMVAAFYLRQALFPLWMGPSYPLRPIVDEAPGFANFYLPVLVCAAFGIWALAEARRGAKALLGLLLLALLLLPAFNIRAFIPEQIVHDRYLYLPLLGLLILVASVASRQAGSSNGPRTGRTVLLVAIIVSLPLAAQTLRYNGAWRSDLALWQWGVRSDPSSAFNHLQLGVSLGDAGRWEESLGSFDRSIELYPLLPNAYSGRADARFELGRYAAAREDLARTLELTAGDLGSYSRLQAYRRIARTFEAERSYAAAIPVLEIARQEMPHRRAALTRDMAILYYQTGDRAAALHQLESVRDQAPLEAGAEARLALYQLGLLYAELGRRAEAEEVWREYLDATASLSDPQTTQARQKVQALLLPSQ